MDQRGRRARSRTSSATTISPPPATQPQGLRGPLSSGRSSRGAVAVGVALGSGVGVLEVGGSAAIRSAIARIRAAGKAAGILTTDVALAREYAELGATFVAFGTDVGLLVRGGEALLRSFQSGEAAAPAVPRGAVY